MLLLLALPVATDDVSGWLAPVLLKTVQQMMLIIMLNSQHSETYEKCCAAII